MTDRTAQPCHYRITGLLKSGREVVLYEGPLSEPEGDVLVSNIYTAFQNNKPAVMNLHGRMVNVLAFATITFEEVKK